jgi:hypothetical protein
MFSIAKCGFCGAFGTKIVEIEPNGAHYKQYAICCQSCNSVLSTTGYWDAGALLKEQEKRLAIIEQKIGSLVSEVQRLSRDR